MLRTAFRLPIGVLLVAAFNSFLIGPVLAANPTVMPFNLIACHPTQGVLFCEGNDATRVPSFDGTPLDLNVTLPSNTNPTRLPLIVLSHGYGGSKIGLGFSKLLAARGYAVLAISARGFGESCGSPSSRSSTPACAQGWVRLDDLRYEIRDVQYLAGILADEKIVDPKRIGFTGESYGGGVSIGAAVLRDRIMDTDGTLKPWTSPTGLPMQTAASVPIVGWSDLAYALTPNGRTLDYTIAGSSDDVAPAGVVKQSYILSLYLAGQSSGFYAPVGADPQADLTTWYNTIIAGEPYDTPEIAAIEAEITSHHSAYYVDDSEAPAPMLLANGWTDDLFPVDEALRFYNRTRKKYPATPTALMFFDFGHPRVQNKQQDVTQLLIRLAEWFDFYLKGSKGVTPLHGVEVLTETCQASAASGGPFFAPNWVAIHPGEVRFQPSDTQTFSSSGGDLTIAAALDPINGKGACAAVTSANEPNTANWSLAPASGRGYTLIGAPTAIFDLTFTGNFPEIAGRLWDVAPKGTQTLVARGIYRPDSEGRQVFQLHASGWRFAARHVAKFQLLGQDSPYARASNGTFSITISNLDLRLPVHEKPDCKQVTPPAAPFVPNGAVLAPDVNPAGGGTCKKH
jgi:pimeloyl-ACP methyl ester carboxylesterase